MDVGHEIKEEGFQRNEAPEQMAERVYSLSSQRLADEINRRYGRSSISASSIRRRHPSPVQCDSPDVKMKSFGPYQSKEYANWEKYRKKASPTKDLADGSCDRNLDEANEDNRQRNLADGALITATIQDAAEVEVEAGNMVMHEGGVGIARLRPPKNAEETEEVRLSRIADDLLRGEGLSPHSTNRSAKRGRKRLAD